MTYRHALVQFEEGSIEILDGVDARPWGLVSLAKWLGLPLLFGLRVPETWRLLGGAAA